jgi:membrane-associated phospholipid phosphatase
MSVKKPFAAHQQQSTNAFQKVVFIIQLIIIIGISVWMMVNGKFPGIELLILLLVIVLVWRMQDRMFLINFAPFLLLLYTYQALRQIADTLGWGSLHITDLIAWERAICGGIIPAVELQKALGTQSFTGALDVVVNLFYMSHFIFPVVLAMILWRYQRRHYWPFLLGLAALSYAAFLTYALFPAAPPWWAAYYHYLPADSISLSHSWISMEEIVNNANPVAAMPSLHAAYPFYISLFIVYIWGRRAVLAFILPAGVAFAAIYMGHHYFIDILAGYAYAGAAFAVVYWFQKSNLMPRWLSDAYRNSMDMINRGKAY